MDTGTCHYCGKVCDIAEPTPPGVTTRFIERLAQEKAALSTEIAELRRHVSTVMQRNDALIDVWAQHETIMPDGALVPTIEAVVKRNAELEDELAAANKRVAELEAQIGGIRSPFIDTSVLIKEGSVKEVIVNGETFVLQEERDIALAICTELVEMIEHGFRIDGVRPNF